MKNHPITLFNQAYEALSKQWQIVVRESNPKTNETLLNFLAKNLYEPIDDNPSFQAIRNAIERMHYHKRME